MADEDTHVSEPLGINDMSQCYTVVPIGITLLEGQVHLNTFLQTLDARKLDDDAAEVILSAATWMQRRTPAKYQDYIFRVKTSSDPRDPRCNAWALLTQQHVTGYAPHWVLVALHTYSEHRRRGFGTAIVNEAVRLAKASAVRSMCLQCRPSNVRFYERLGFAVRPSETPENSDFVDMRRRLDD